MKLSQLADEYVTFKRSLGMRFRTESVILNAFCRAMGDIDITQVSSGSVQNYLAGTGPITAFWHRKFEALSGFYRYVVSRGHISLSPLPTIFPKRPTPFQPYIYTHDEYRRLVEMTHVLDKNQRGQVQPATFRTLLLLLYGTGLPAHHSQHQILQDQMGAHWPSTEHGACHLRKAPATAPSPRPKQIYLFCYAHWDASDTKHCRTDFPSPL
jgi:hypothetical protein